MDETIKIAGMQMEPVILDKERNLARCLELVDTAAGEGARLVLFPEAALSGYVFGSLEEALPVVETVPGPSTQRIADCCRELKVHVVVGLLEEDRGRHYNTAALVGPSGLVGKYRKSHLPYVGIDRFLNHGDLPWRVYATDIGQIGLGICYDLDFPEHARALALMGAEVIVLVTNWPQGVEFAPEHLIHARAIENSVYCLAVNRVGEEWGIKFFGRSKFVDCLGRTIAEGRPYREDILYAEINPALARQKRRVRVPGEFEVDMVGDRRPELYGILTRPSGGNSPAAEGDHSQYDQ
jgi:predicted amidohydrolase